jgi:hypothetical protein
MLPLSAVSPLSSSMSGNHRYVLIGLLATLLCGCGNNIGRIWDRNVGPSEPGESVVQRMVAQGNPASGRPRVEKVFPEGNGWPVTVPIVVVFSETINEASVAPQSGTPNLFLQVQGTDTALPATYDFLFGSTVVVIRPAAPLGSGQEIVTYEVVVTPNLRDGDGVTFGGKENKVVATFTPDQADTVEDGKILTVLPLDKSKDQRRESIVYAVFTKPADQASVKTGAAGNFNVRQKGSSTVVAGGVSFPVGATPIGGGDPRIAAFTSTAVLGGSLDYEIVVDNSITFGNGAGKLDFNNRTPFATFQTLAFEDVDSVAVGNPTAGYPDQVNRNNMVDLMIDVDLPDSAAVGDRVTVRVYGVDASDPNKAAIAFAEAGVDLTMAGDHVATVSFSGKLGTLTSPKLADSVLTIAAQLTRGSRRAGYVLSDADNNPRLDITPPMLTQVGPPTGVDTSDFVTDQEHAVFFGQADEGLGAVSLTAASVTKDAYALSGNGRFMLKPLYLGRLTMPLSYTINLTDDSGNDATQPFMGNIIQRGVITDASMSSTLVVEAYDESTLRPLVGVTVLIDEGMPQATPVGRQTMVTDSTGRATFTGLTTTSNYSITLVGGGYHLTSLLDTPARFVSLPLRPLINATATLNGTQNFQPLTGQSLLAGCNIIDDILVESIASTTAAPTALLATAVRPNRPYVLTAFSGIYEPTSLPAFNNYACLICGPTGLVATPAATAIAPGATATTNQTLIPSIFTARDLATPYTKDFADSTGLDTGDLAGPPTVRVQTSLFGFGGMTTFGVGQALPGMGAEYTIDATYLAASAIVVLDLGPKLWVSTEATDTSGNVARHRRLIIDPVGGITVAAVNTPGIPTVTTPGGSSTGAPAVEFQDRLDPADIAFGLGFAMQTLTATDGNGRTWRVLREDTNGKAGATTWQLPVFSSPTGLATGSWSIRAEGQLFFSSAAGTADMVLEETRREEVTYARAAAKSFTVN